MFDLSFYELIKWAWNFDAEQKDFFHKRTIARTITCEMNKYMRFSWFVLYLTRKEHNNFNNISEYMDGYFEYFL